MRIWALEDVESQDAGKVKVFFLPSQKLTYPTKREKESHRSKCIYISPEKMYDIVGLERQVVLNKTFF